MSEKKINPKRAKLIQLSNKAREMREELEELEGETINSIVIDYFYKDINHQQFETYRQWRELGYQVKKGSKAFVIWGRKRKAQKQEKEKEEKDEYKFFPLAYLFSNAQVEPIKEKAPA